MFRSSFRGGEADVTILVVVGVSLLPDGRNDENGWATPVRLVEVIERHHRLALMPALGLLLMFVLGGSQPEAAGLIPPPWDKLAHLAWFAVLAGLLHAGLGFRHALWVVTFCVGVALWDEWRQLALPGRAAGWDDLLFDGLGIMVGVGLPGKSSAGNMKV